MDTATKHIVNYHVIFKKSPLKHWVFNWLDSEIQHCYAVKESPGGEFWIVIDAKNSVTEVQLLSKIDYPHIRCIEPDSVILSIRAIIDPSNYRHTLCVFNCVEQVKALLGIRAFWIWTPYQLYKRLNHG